MSVRQRLIMREMLPPHTRVREEGKGEVGDVRRRGVRKEENGADKSTRQRKRMGENRPKEG